MKPDLNRKYEMKMLTVKTKTERDMLMIKEILKSEKVGKVVLRFDIEPERYWEVRKTLEAELNGSKTVHLFGFGNDVLVCEKISIPA